MTQHTWYRAGERLATRLPIAWSYWLARRLADVSYRRFAHDRQVVRDNLRRLLGLTERRVDLMVQDTFRLFGQYLVDLLRAGNGHSALLQRLRVEGLEHLEAARARGHGVIILSAHLGQWELGAMAVRQLGIPVTVVAQPHEDPDVDRMFLRWRAQCGVATAAPGPRLRRCYRTLRANGAVGLLGDRDFGAPAIRTPFGQAELNVPTGPAVLALRTGAAIVPTFMLREHGGHHKLVLEPSILPEGPDDAAAVQRLTHTAASVLERYVCTYPTQWFMFHPVLRPPQLAAAPAFAFRAAARGLRSLGEAA